MVQGLPTWSAATTIRKMFVSLPSAISSRETSCAGRTARPLLRGSAPADSLPSCQRPNVRRSGEAHAVVRAILAEINPGGASGDQRRDDGQTRVNAQSAQAQPLTLENIEASRHTKSFRATARCSFVWRVRVAHRGDEVGGAATAGHHIGRRRLCEPHTRALDLQRDAIPREAGRQAKKKSFQRQRNLTDL